jgi:hypothetical protein
MKKWKINRYLTINSQNDFIVSYGSNAHLGSFVYNLIQVDSHESNTSSSFFYCTSTQFDVTFMFIYAWYMIKIKAFFLCIL